jgi:hypothetical protein
MRENKNQWVKREQHYSRKKVEKKKNIKTNQEKSINISKHLIRSDRHHDVVVKKK